ncbi:MAG: thiamine-monophosphate kinase, partial [Planctomycetota bacterium]
GRIWTRSGAQPEDWIVVTGRLGGSILGKHLEFTPRFDVARRLRDMPAVHAAMDISDGLSIDLLRMCDASRCGAILDPDAVPIADAAVQLASTSGRTPLEHALGDGEDFELLLAVDAAGLAELRRCLGAENCFVCGRFTSRTGLWIRRGGRIEQLPATGYLHGTIDSDPQRC